MLPEPLQQIDRTWVQWRGHTLAYFAGCDYFRMASHPAVLAAARAAIDQYGLNVAASRYTTGNHLLYNQLEESLADFFNVESATIVSTGFLTNLAAIQNLIRDFDEIVIDSQAHQSLVQAAVSVPFPVWSFGHCDPEDLRSILADRKRPLLLTDSVFAHDGSVAPLAEYARLLPPSSWMIVDDSHGAGILDFPKLNTDRIVRTTTLSKAFGSFGGAILSSQQLKTRLEENPVLRGATPLPLPYAAAALASLHLLKDPSHRDRLRQNIRRVGETSTNVPILAFGSDDQEAFSRELLNCGIFPSCIRYQAESYFRFAISSEHTRAQLDALAAAIPFIS